MPGDRVAAVHTLGPGRPRGGDRGCAALKDRTASPALPGTDAT